MVDKVVRDGKVALLVSSSFGAGWSSYNNHNQDFLLMDAGLVNLREQNASEYVVEAYIKSALELDEDTYVSMYGWEDVDIVWVPVGTKFYIHEYDGRETVRLVENLHIIIA